MRRLARAVGDRQPAWEIACPAQRVDVAAIGVDDRVEARDQADDREEGQRFRGGAAVYDAEAVEERLR